MLEIGHIIKLHYDTVPYVPMTLNHMSVEQSGHFVTWTHARDHGMNSLSFLFNRTNNKYLCNLFGVRLEYTVTVKIQKITGKLI